MKKIMISIMLVLAVWVLSLSCYAADVNLVKIPAADMAEVKTNCGDDYSLLNHSEWTQYFKVSGDYFVMDNTFDTLDASKRLDLIVQFVDSLNTWNITTNTKQAIYTKVYDSISDYASVVVPELLQDVSADLGAAYVWYLPFSGPVGIGLGIGVILIILLLIFSTVADLAYLSSPATVESIMEDITDDNKPPLVSRDAMSVAKDAAMSNTSKNLYSLYFRKRWITFIILALAVLYLISGKIGDLIGWLLSLTSGMIG